MAEKGWTTQAGAAAGIAAGAGAAQLGLGYGLGVIAWPATLTEAESLWLGSLGWATWITASATVLGAVIAGRMRADRAGRWRSLWRFALATSAALGALVSVALVALPARSAVRADTLSPQLVAVGYALIGLVTGVVVAYWAVSSTPVATNLLGTAAWLWALAVAAVAAGLITGRSTAAYPTSWQFAETDSPVRYGGIYWPSAALTLFAAFVIGLIAVWPAVRRGDLGLGSATSGAVGPLLVAISFLALAPQLTEALGPLQSAYLIAPYAVLAGLAGSAMMVALGRGRRTHQPSPGDTPLPTAPTPPPAPVSTPAAPPAPASTSAKPAAAAKPEPTKPEPTRPQPSTGVEPAKQTPTATAPKQPAPADQAKSKQAPAAEQAKPAPRPRTAAKATGAPAAEATPAAGAAVEVPADRAPRRRWFQFGARKQAEESRAYDEFLSDLAKPAESAAATGKSPARKPSRRTPATKPAPEPATPTAQPTPTAEAKPTKSPAPKPSPTAGDSAPATTDGAADPELAALARPSKNAARRAAARKTATASRSTITPPPANPTVARINPDK
ncbi:Hansenula MRAKII killer toxin-resistant protein 1 [Actinoplanes sp. NPDC051851]|uniref:Hansenula MRAKII killer toxin-resistant protein 1 n=1 Tax=Actinoplanes sp. NPDC051851 TaxID=3154753 RepID=UPI00344805B1